VNTVNPVFESIYVLDLFWTATLCRSSMSVTAGGAGDGDGDADAGLGVFVPVLLVQAPVAVVHVVVVGWLHMMLLVLVEKKECN